jgi:hypothetical protein
MKRGDLPWWKYRRIISRISNIRNDWLTPVEYLPYIDALLGDIDLDPCSTHLANSQFLRAKKIYTYDEDGLSTLEPWTGQVYLFPPTYGRCSYIKDRGVWRWGKHLSNSRRAASVIWFYRLLREWKLRNVREALFYTTNSEMLRVIQEVWDFPICIPKTRAKLIHGSLLFEPAIPLYWGFFVYLPPPDFGLSEIDRFSHIFSNLGRVIA